MIDINIKAAKWETPEERTKEIARRVEIYGEAFIVTTEFGDEAFIDSERITRFRDFGPILPAKSIQRRYLVTIRHGNSFLIQPIFGHKPKDGDVTTVSKGQEFSEPPGNSFGPFTTRDLAEQCVLKLAENKDIRSATITEVNA